MKIIKLIQNETIKTLKKTSTKILIILSILALLASVGLAKLIMSLNNSMGYLMSNEENWQSTMKEQIADMQKEIQTQGTHYDRESLANLKAQKETYEIALKCNINYMYYIGYDNWKIQVLNEIQTEKIKDFLNSESQDNRDTNKLIELLEKDDFEGYIELLKQKQKTMLDSKQLSKEEYDDEIYLLELRKKYEIYKADVGMFDWKGNLYEDISVMRKNLRTGINERTGKLLKLEEIDEIKENLKIAEYRLEENLPLQSSGGTERSLYDMFAPSFSLIMVSILMIIIAGSSISTEISKGTIKFLLFTPNKRWKVLLSKILSAVIILFVLTLILSLISVVIGNIFFKEAGTTYVYAHNGEAKALSSTLHTILYFLASDIDILVYMLFAFMLSVITKNTALSVRSEYSLLCWFWNGNANYKSAYISRLDKICTI